ncbi:PQQ-binding-like beta-propeller repeat protein [Botrimarina mediterranea]|uniref:Outer membrane biogenesis protein BamB n=1 Tax=Botrimarina mediterranea TaxID=2528022 RepID=A0A518KB44_9BACT|nr:PQQ-binding-like beta-propeller repeat protein [Botrimarina mediterranea]QDV75017.1 outer membrane biogenesis protein BamB [Botrimarina mediterranea]
MTRRLLALALVTATASAMASDWPQWLGPDRDGLTKETGILQEWPEGGPKQVWLSREAGLGYSGPAIVDGKLFILGSRDGTEQLIAFDAMTGDELWATDIGDEYENDWGNGPRNTPTVDGDRIYALGARGNLICVEIASGKEVWRVAMQDFGGSIPQWGYAESPLVDEDRVVVTPGGDQGAIVALDKATGELLWQAAELKPTAHYSSIVVGEPHGEKQYIQLLQDQLVGVDPANGKLLWTVGWPGRVAVIPTPIVDGDRVYATMGYGVGCMLVEISEDNTATKVYENKVMKNKHGGVVLLDGKLYGHSDGVGWVCQDFETGETVWRERSALEMGAIGYADGRFVCLGEDSGEVVLIEASPEGWKEHGRFKLDPQTEQRKPQGKIWVHPVIAGGKLYLRDQELLFCFDVSADK